MFEGSGAEEAEASQNGNFGAARFEKKEPLEHVHDVIDDILAQPGCLQFLPVENFAVEPSPCRNAAIFKVNEVGSSENR